MTQEEINKLRKSFEESEIFEYYDRHGDKASWYASLRMDYIDPKKQSIRGIKGGNSNVNSGWIKELNKIGTKYALADKTCEHCGVTGTLINIATNHGINCRQTPDIIMPILNALPNQFMLGMITPFMTKIGMLETLQRTIENEKWFKKIKKIKTYYVYARGENYYKYKDQYNENKYDKVTVSVEEYIDTINESIKKAHSLKIESNILELYNSLPNEFHKSDSMIISEFLGIPKQTVEYITKNKKLVDSKYEDFKKGTYGTPRTIYTKKIKSIKDINSIGFEKNKNKFDLRRAYKEMVQNLYPKFITDSKVDINSMYDYIVKNVSDKEVGPVKNKQKLTKQLYALNLEVIFIDYELDNKLKTILNAINTIEFTMKDLGKACKDTGLKTKIHTLLEKEYCVKIYDGVKGSKFDVPIYKKI
jgi:hypothetical protein